MEGRMNLLSVDNQSKSCLPSFHGTLCIPLCNFLTTYYFFFILLLFLRRGRSISYLSLWSQQLSSLNMSMSVILHWEMYFFFNFTFLLNATPVSEMWNAFAKCLLRVLLIGRFSLVLMSQRQERISMALGLGLNPEVILPSGDAELWACKLLWFLTGLTTGGHKDHQQAWGLLMEYDISY